MQTVGGLTNVSETSGSSTGVWETLTGEFTTNAVPGTVNIQFVLSAAASVADIAYVMMREIEEDDYGNREGDLVQFTTSTSTTAANINTDLLTVVVPPGNNYSITVRLEIHLKDSGANDKFFQGFITQSINGAAATQVRRIAHSHDGGNAGVVNLYSQANAEFTIVSPTPGSRYEFGFEQTQLTSWAYDVSGTARTHSMTVELRKMT
jgi:hypothetical protein